MGIGGSIFLIAAGAILAWGVHVNNTHGFDLNTIGVILMIVGAVGLAVFLAVFGRRRTSMVERRDVVAPGSTVYTRDVY